MTPTLFPAKVTILDIPLRKEMAKEKFSHLHPTIEGKIEIGSVITNNITHKVDG